MLPADVSDTIAEVRRFFTSVPLCTLVRALLLILFVPHSRARCGGYYAVRSHTFDLMRGVGVRSHLSSASEDRPERL